MVQTITPVVHGARRSRWALSLAAHALAATLSAAALGAVLGVAGAALGAPWGRGGLILVAAIAGAYALREMLGVPVPLPEVRRQVPEWWRSQFRPEVASFLYGVGLGVGFATHLGHGTVVAVWAAALASGDPLAGAALLAPFGLARAGAVAVASDATTAERVTEGAERLERWATGSVPRLANAAVLFAVLTAAVLASLETPLAGSSGLAPLVLAAVFAISATAKAARFAAWRRALDRYGMFGPASGPLAVVVPLVEAGTAVLLFVDVRLGSGLALVLVAAFSAVLVRARARSGDRVPCGCFGGEKTRDVRAMLARNAALAGLAVLSLVARPEPAPALRPPGPAELLPAGLAVGGAVLTLVVLRSALRLLGRSRSG